MEIRCDVAVIGAGPAGSMAARALARAGVDVVLADRASFPRDKVCGDALLPDAVAALEEAGLDAIVRREALAVPRAVLRSPSGASVALAGRFLTLARERLDALLVEGARQAGARFVPGFLAASPIEDGGGITGVAGRLDSDDGGAPARILSRAVVIAAGSNPRLLEAFGVLRRPLHSAVAIRGYLPYDPFAEPGPPAASRPPSRQPHALLISYERSLMPGYGWSFPLPGGMWNVGCGVVVKEPRPRDRGPARDATGGSRGLGGVPHRRRSRSGEGGAAGEGVDLRALLARFLRTAPDSGSARDDRFPPPSWWRSVRGATLRTGFAGADPVRGTVLVAGESLGLTLPLTGDGIGKAMQSGLIAAQCLVAALTRPGRALDASGYAAALEARLRHTYRAYDTAQRWIGVPIVPDLLVRRAARSMRLRRMLEEIVAETIDPRVVLSPLGLVRASIL